MYSQAPHRERKNFMGRSKLKSMSHRTLQTLRSETYWPATHKLTSHQCKIHPENLQYYSPWLSASYRNNDIKVFHTAPNIPTSQARLDVTSYPYHDKAFDQFFSHSQEQEKKKPQYSNPYILHAEGDVQYRQFSKYFCSLQSSVVYTTERTQCTNFTLTVITNEEVFFTGSRKGTGNGGSILASY